ncbi:MAG TPA: hypothetical protein VGO75_13910 [Gemmatimonadaceae bacterium]|jgi:hypothetical protein|nr:hypothetical protein [Gemmatimonadaceae bacterium]
MHVSSLSSALLLFTALTLTACTDPGPVAPDAAGLDAPNSVSLGRSSGESERSDHVTTTPVTWTLQGGTCGLKTTVTGTGVMHTVTHSHQSRNGVWHVGYEQEAHGTARGADGSRYIFNYAIVAKSVNPTGPNDLSLIYIVDTFNLIGLGKAPDMHVFLKGKFTYPAFEPVDNPIIRGPGLFCDPI